VGARQPAHSCPFSQPKTAPPEADDPNALIWLFPLASMCRYKVLMGTNIPVKTFQGLKHYTTEQVIWRDAQTGKELASSSQFPKMTQGILVTPGYAGLQYFPHRRRPHHRPASHATTMK
jgi:hypothetical protein